VCIVKLSHFSSCIVYEVILISSRVLLACATIMDRTLDYIDIVEMDYGQLTN